jgi:serine dehydrogenase proteinase
MGTIDYDCVLRLRKIFDDFAPVPQLDVLIQSGGGDIHHAHRCLRVLRRSGGKVTAFIPFWCKSAATYVALGTDEMLFGVDGELGPLDTQMGDPSGSLERRSALNEFRSLEYIRNHALETLNMLYLFMMDKHMDVPYALDRAQAGIGEFVGPLYHQVRSQNLGEFYRYLTISEEYGIRVMRRWGYASRSEDEISKMVKHLVWDYPAHEFVIDLQEAQDMKLNATAMPADLDRLCTAVVRAEVPIFELFRVNEMARPEIVPVEADAPAAAQGSQAVTVQGDGSNGGGERELAVPAE